MNSLRSLVAALSCLILGGCGATTKPKIIVLGIDGMDPAFVERHWDALPNLKALQQSGYFSRLGTTTPPQSPVAWSTFITGLDPDQHGIYDFVHREANTLRLFSSMSKTEEPRFVLPLGPYLLPLSSSRVSSLRHGTPFWRKLSDRGIPVMVQHMPANYPPETAGKALAGMGTPDLLGTLGTFTFFTSDPMELPRSVPGGRIVKAHVSNGRALLTIEGPANPLRKEHPATTAVLTLDVDAENDAARIKLGEQAVIVHKGEWSGWLTAEFSLIPHVSSIRGLVRVYAKQLHPDIEIYVSPINLDPGAPALPISAPAKWSAEVAEEVGPFGTLGIAEDTSALRQGALDLGQFREQAELVFADEVKLLDYSLRTLKGGLLFFYFSSVDQNSHVLWGKHEDELLKVYHEVDQQVGKVRRQEPDAELIILSDHGFTTFDRAVHLNTWLRQRGFLGQELASLETEAYAVGLNGLYLNRRGLGLDRSKALLATLREQLLAWRDPTNGKAVIDSVAITHPSVANKDVAPDLIVGYAAGYRASWQTALGEAPSELIENNNDAWIGDHCVDPRIVPGVLFGSGRLKLSEPRLQDVTGEILRRYGVTDSAH